MDDQINAHLKKLDCPQYYEICLKYFMAHADGSVPKDKSNPADIMFLELKAKPLPNETIKSSILKTQTKNEFFSTFFELFDIDNIQLFKYSILAQTLINQSAMSIKTVNEKAIQIYIMRGYISLFLLLQKNMSKISKDEPIKNFPQQCYAALHFLISFFLSSNIEKSLFIDFLRILPSFYTIFDDYLKDILNLEDNTNNHFYIFFLNILQVSINLLKKIANLGAWSLFLFPCNVFLLYFSKQRIVKKDEKMSFLFFELCQKLEETLNEKCPENVESKISFILSTILSNVDSQNPDYLKIGYEIFRIFPILTTISKDNQSALIFATNLANFLNNFSKSIDFQEVNELREDDVKDESLIYVNPQEYFKNHNIIRFTPFTDKNFLEILKKLKKYFSNSNFDLKILLNVFSVIFDTFSYQSLIILLSSLSEKCIKTGEAMIDFIFKLFSLDIFNKNEKLIGIEYFTLESIMVFLFNIISKSDNSDAQAILSSLSKLDFRLIQRILPVFRSLLMINDEIRFSRNFCNSNIIEVVRMNVNKMEDNQQAYDEIVAFIQIVATNDPRNAFASFSLSPMIKELVIKPRYRNFLLPCFRAGLVTTDETCVTNILGQIAAILYQVVDDRKYVEIASSSLNILANSANSLNRNSLKIYEERNVFEIIAKLPLITKEKSTLISALRFFLHVCLKFNSYIQVFTERLIYQLLYNCFEYFMNLKDDNCNKINCESRNEHENKNELNNEQSRENQSERVELDFEMFNLILSMSMNKETNLEEIEKYSIVNRSALRLLLRIMKGSSNELEFLKIFEKICMSNNSNIYECYQAGFLLYLLDRISVKELQEEVFIIFKMICTMFCSPMTLNKIYSTILVSDDRINILDKILDMITSDSNFPVPSFFTFNGNRTGIFGPSINLNYLASSWSFSTSLNFENANFTLLNLTDGNSVLSFSINQNFNLEFKRIEVNMNYRNYFKYQFKQREWTSLTVTFTQNSISLYINYELTETIQLDEKFTFGGPAMIKIGEGFIGEIGPTHFFNTIEIIEIKKEIEHDQMVKQKSICSYDPRGAYLGEIIDAATDNLCHLMGTAVPFCTALKETIQLDGVYQMFLKCFSVVDSAEYLKLTIQILHKILVSSTSNERNFEKIGGFRLLLGILMQIKPEYFTKEISILFKKLFLSMKYPVLIRQMIVVYWLNLAFISTLPSEYQIQFYRKDFPAVFQKYKGGISLDSIETIIYEIITKDNQKIEFKNNELDIKSYQINIISNFIKIKPNEIIHCMFDAILVLNDKPEIQQKFMEIIIKNTKGVNFRFPADSLLPFLNNADINIRFLALNIIAKVSEQQRKFVLNAISYIHDDLGDLFTKCYNLMFNDPDTIHYLEILPILLVLSFYTDNDDLYFQIYNHLSKFSLFYKENTAPIFLLIFSFKAYKTNNLEKMVEPFISAVFSNIDLLPYINNTLNSFEKFYQINLYEVKLTFVTQLVMNSIYKNKFFEIISNFAVQFMCYRHNTENENSDRINIVTNNENESHQTKLEIIDLNDYTSYLKELSNQKDIAYIFEYKQELSDNQIFLTKVNDILSLRDDEDCINISSQVKYNISSFKDIIEAIMSSKDKNALSSLYGFTDQNLVDEFSDVLNKELQQFTKDQIPLLHQFINSLSKSLFKESKQNSSKQYKKFFKDCKQRLFMFETYNSKLATTFLRESDEIMLESTKKHWRVSTKSDLYGRRMFFSVNRNFDDHKKASSLRDSVAFENQEDEQIIPFKKILDINHSLMKKKGSHKKSFEVLLVTILGQYSGIIYVSNQMLFFEGTMKYDTFNTNVKSPGNGSKKNEEEKRQKFIRIPLNHILFIFNRFTMHVDNSCEIFCNNMKSFLFIFSENKTRKAFYDCINEIVGQNFKKLPYSYFYSDCRNACNGLCQNMSNMELLSKIKLCNDWQNRKVSNFGYLYFLNTLSGRSFNDLSQYPVYPWVLKDYQSETIDLNDESIYRDFSLPIAAMNEERLKECYHSYNEIDDVLEKCLYRSHYSNPAVVIGYMIRQEPYSSLHIDLQSGRFDHPERLFFSFQRTWDNITSPSNDFKELIPEFFTFPQILVNENNYDLGFLQISKFTVSDVILPNWAKNAHSFIEIHRRALESEYVRMHLNEWVDLVFGCYQRSKEKNSLFHIYSYHECMNLPEIRNDEASQQMAQHHAANFGSCPDKLFNSLSPKSINYIVPQNVQIDGFSYQNMEQDIVYFGKGMICLLKNGEIINLLKNFQVSKVSMKIQPQYRDILCIPEKTTFVFLQRNGGFASCVNYQLNDKQIQQAQKIFTLKTISHSSSTIECMCSFGPEFIATGGSDCCLNLWRVPEFDKKATIPIQCGVIVALAGDVSVDTLAAIDDQNIVYLASSRPPRHILTFALNCEENVTKHKISVLRNGIISIASESFDRKSSQLVLFDLRGYVIKEYNFDDRIGIMFPIYPSFGEDFLVLLMSNTKKIVILDLATFEVNSSFQDCVYGTCLAPFEDRRSILYIKNIPSKELGIFNF
ncbi:hypothetical protein TRFO_31965 [Tritrichomonas foetus]|uniref:BEACH domain-containing protein n=1 Tax=Tritrichomonas foetus TaxID=1144522 RepID=A0A1J4JS47_9EUKA|nr:hypothetical protein TRFO_31965 [Tritrichomonas foetus]|eukprot:OHT01256.1 hypothetical protein TRFO_31965 [Tritrichomonas foetus]